MKTITGIAGDTPVMVSDDVFLPSMYTKNHILDLLDEDKTTSSPFMDTLTSSFLTDATSMVANTSMSSKADTSTVTVFTVNHEGLTKLSVTFIAPTITTNSLPTGLSNASIPTLNYNMSSTSNKSSISSINIYPSLYSSSLIPVYSDIDSLDTMFSSLSSPSSKIKSTLKITPETTETDSTSTTAAGTVTITEYLEEVTYTQAYVLTDSRTTLTTAFLATTSFYISPLTSTYSISPAAITTDINALKSRLDLNRLYEKHKLNKGAIAGISVGVILAFLCLVGFLTYFLLRKGNIRSKFYGSFLNDDNIDRGYELEEENFNTPENFNQHLFNFNNSRQTSLPPIPNRENKPIINVSTSPGDLNNSVSMPEEDDLGLFDMKSTLNSIGNGDKLLPPLPLPKLRKNRGINSINKLNHTVDDTPLTPVSKLPFDRTMGVLYESPNEQPIWDEFETARNLGFMTEDNTRSPVRRGLDTTALTCGPGLGSQNDDFESFRTTLSVPRVRSGSGATRYEYLSNNVESFKQELRLSSPLKTSFDLEDDEWNPKKIPPPIPQPRKSTH